LLKPVKTQYTVHDRGIDQGGLTADLFCEFFIKVVDEKLGLFECASEEDAPTSGLTYLPIASNPNLSFYRAVGRFLCKAMIDMRTVPARFALSVYKYILGETPTIQDLDIYDRTKAMSLRSLLTMPNVE